MNPNVKIVENIGSPLFMAPEILFGRPYDNKVDIYSLGCFLFNLMTGKYPYFETNLKRFVKLVKNTEYKMPT